MACPLPLLGCPSNLKAPPYPQGRDCELTALDLGNNSITDEGAKSIASMLQV